MNYIIYYDDYHGHSHNETFYADDDQDAIEKANDIVCGLRYDTDELYCIEEKQNRKIIW